jgi:hypothetical protein
MLCPSSTGSCRRVKRNSMKTTMSGRRRMGPCAPRRAHPPLRARSRAVTDVTNVRKCASVGREASCSSCRVRSSHELGP